MTRTPGDQATGGADGDRLAGLLAEDLDRGFAALVGAYETVVHSVAWRVCGSRADAEDLAAETFLRAYRALLGYGPDRLAGLRLRSWLVTICLNQWRNQLRAAARRPVTTSLDGHDPRSDGAGPDGGADAGDGGLAVLLGRLPEAQRVAVVLRHVAGLSQAEIADAMGCPPGTVKSHVGRGLERLRRMMTEEDT